MGSHRIYAPLPAKVHGLPGKQSGLSLFPGQGHFHYLPVWVFFQEENPLGPWILFLLLPDEEEQQQNREKFSRRKRDPDSRRPHDACQQESRRYDDGKAF